VLALGKIEVILYSKMDDVVCSDDVVESVMMMVSKLWLDCVMKDDGVT
jgi:hypothetical protein